MLVIVLLTSLCSASVAVLSATRAFVGGESLYSKAQKDAVRSLERYISSGDEADYAHFKSALMIPMGDRDAQLELEKQSPNLAAVRRSFIEARNSPLDIGGMIRLYQLFRHVSFMREAIDIWARADEDIKTLAELGPVVKSVIVQRPFRITEQRDLLRRVDLLNDRLDNLEQQFSARLGEASRAVQTMLQLATIILGSLLALMGMLFARRMSLRLAASQRAVHASNQRWLLASSVAHIGVFDWDVEADTFVLDERTFELYRMEPTPTMEVKADELRAYVMEPDRPDLSAATRRAIHEANLLTHRYRIRRGDGEIRHLELQGRATYSSEHAGRHFVGLVRDITDEVLAGQLQAERHSAEEASRAKDEFLSRVSHELRTPLNAIMGFSQLMSGDVSEPLGPMQSMRLQRVTRAGQYLLGLVNDLLRVGKDEEALAPLQLGPVDVCEAIEAAISTLEPAQSAREVTVEFPRSKEPLWVRADLRRLEQVLMNVLSNSIKYNRPHGRVRVGCEASPATIVISIDDDGIGMTRQQQAQLFQPFNRLGAERSGVEGAGLGLVICKQLILSMGGDITISSEPRRGTVVRLSLIRDEARTVPEAAQTCPVARLDSLEMPAGLILYIEDDPVNALLVQQYLARWPQVRVVIAEDGAAGLREVRARRPDLVLLDMQLPDMTGLAVLSALRLDPSLPRLPVVALSADAMPRQIAASVAAGADAYWTKPLELGRFCVDVASVLRKSTAAVMAL